MDQVWKKRWLLGAAAVALALGAAPASALAQVALGPADEAIGKDGFYMEADTMVRDAEHQTWIAKGSVEARYQGKVLRADELDYDQASGVVTATGDVQMLNPDGTSEFAKSMTLDKEFNAGLALAFATRQEPNVKLVADEAIRLNKDAMALNKAVFTVCDLCAPDGTPQTPTWSIQAAQVIQDHEHKIIFYRHAVMRVKGLPVFYTPLFWHTDPSAKRGSGLLPPQFGITGMRGFTYQQPYLWVISPYSDLIITPQLNTGASSLLMGEYRKRFYSGQMDARFGYTYARAFDSSGNVYDDLTSRSYLVSAGAFNINKDWNWGFTAERVTDPLLFQRYDVPNLYGSHGLYQEEDQRLLSQIYSVRQDSRSYLSMAVLNWQGLRVGDLNGTFPTVAPLIEGHFDPNMNILGGRLRIDGSAVVLQRPRNVSTDIGPGNNQRRATASANWRSTYTLYNGIRLEPFAEARGDLYNVDGVAPPTDTGMHTTARALGTLGVDASWPFYRRSGDLTVVLEPLAQLAVSPRAVRNPYITNEDSQVIDFDETNLFEANKSPGFDYYEGGARANVGERVTFRWDGGGQVQLLGGRSFRTVQDPTLPARSSLDRTASDWVVAASASPFPGFSTSGRALLDGETGHILRLSAGANAAVSRLNGYVRYFHDDVDFQGQKTDGVTMGAGIFLTKHWGLSGSTDVDLNTRLASHQTIGLVYQDECIHWELDYVHNGTVNRALRPTDLIVVRLLLVTLGSTGYQRPDFR